MNDQNVQLTRDNLVGNEIVLEDIFPRTNTESVQNNVTGEMLNATLVRLTNEINNHLSRIVNSWNARTGVVVATAEDVGLGNVENISTDDLRKWINRRFVEEFGNKRMKLFNNLHEAAEVVNNNNLEDRDSPFFSRAGFNKDRKSYVGYIFLCPVDGVLKHTQMQINLSGWADMSMKWDWEWNEDNNPNDRNSTGRMGVNIWNYEEALEVYKAIGDPDNIDKETGGVRIVPDAFATQLFFFDGIYGTGTPQPHGALLHRTNASVPSNSAFVRILIDGVQVRGDSTFTALGQTWTGLFRLATNGIRNANQTWERQFDLGNLIYTRFADERSGTTVPSGMHASLLSRNSAIGRVTVAPNVNNRQTTLSTPNENPPPHFYQIEFWRIEDKIGWGLQRIQDHGQTINGTQVRDWQITPKLARGRFTGGGEVSWLNTSGLQVFKDATEANLANFAQSSQIADRYRRLNTPIGPQAVLGDTMPGGIHIVSDMSIAIMPHRLYRNDNDRGIQNWHMTTPSIPNSDDDNPLASGVLEESSLIGLNLLKNITTTGTGTARTHRVGSASGLKIIQHGTGENAANRLSRGHFGVTNNRSVFTWNNGDRRHWSDIDTQGSNVWDNNDFNLGHSGGLSLNINASDSLLEITPPGTTRTAANFDQGGQVRVRYDQDFGLIHGMNRLRIWTHDNGGLTTLNRSGLMFRNNASTSVVSGGEDVNHGTNANALQGQLQLRLAATIQVGDPAVSNAVNLEVRTDSVLSTFSEWGPGPFGSGNNAGLHLRLGWGLFNQGDRRLGLRIQDTNKFVDLMEMPVPIDSGTTQRWESFRTNNPVRHGSPIREGNIGFQRNGHTWRSTGLTLAIQHGLTVINGTSGNENTLGLDALRVHLAPSSGLWADTNGLRLNLGDDNITDGIRIYEGHNEHGFVVTRIGARLTDQGGLGFWGLAPGLGHNATNPYNPTDDPLHQRSIHVRVGRGMRVLNQASTYMISGMTNVRQLGRIEAHIMEVRGLQFNPNEPSRVVNNQIHDMNQRLQVNIGRTLDTSTNDRNDWVAGGAPDQNSTDHNRRGLNFRQGSSDLGQIELWFHDRRGLQLNPNPGVDWNGRLQINIGDMYAMRPDFPGSISGQHNEWLNSVHWHASDNTLRDITNLDRHIRQGLTFNGLTGKMDVWLWNHGLDFVTRHNQVLRPTGTVTWTNYQQIVRERTGRLFLNHGWRMPAGNNTSNLAQLNGSLSGSNWTPHPTWRRNTNGTWNIPVGTNTVDSVSVRVLNANGWTRFSNTQQWCPPGFQLVNNVLVERPATEFISSRRWIWNGDAVGNGTFTIPNTTTLAQQIVADPAIDTRRGLQITGTAIRTNIGRGLRFRGLENDWDRRHNQTMPHDSGTIEINANSHFRFEDVGATSRIALNSQGTDIITENEILGVRHSPAQHQLTPDSHPQPWHGDYAFWGGRNIWNNGITRIGRGTRPSNSRWNPANSRGWFSNPENSYTAPFGFMPPQGNSSVAPPFSWRRDPIGVWSEVNTISTSAPGSRWNPPGWTRSTNSANWSRLSRPGSIPNEEDWTRNGTTGSSFNPPVPNTNSLLLLMGWTRNADRTWTMPIPATASRNYTRNNDNTWNIPDTHIPHMESLGWVLLLNNTMHPPGWISTTVPGSNVTDGRFRAPQINPTGQGISPVQWHFWNRSGLTINPLTNGVTGAGTNSWILHNTVGGNSDSIITDTSFTWRVPSTETVANTDISTTRVNTLNGYGMTRNTNGSWNGNDGNDTWDTVTDIGDGNWHRVITRIRSLPGRFDIADSNDMNFRPNHSFPGWILLPNGRWVFHADFENVFQLPPGWNRRDINNTWQPNGPQVSGFFRAETWLRPQIQNPPTQSPYTPWTLLTNADGSPQLRSFQYDNQDGRGVRTFHTRVWRTPNINENIWLPTDNSLGLPITDRGLGWFGPTRTNGTPAPNSEWTEPIGYNWLAGIATPNFARRLPEGWVENRPQTDNQRAIWREPMMWTPGASGIPVFVTAAGQTPQGTTLPNPRIEWILPHPGQMMYFGYPEEAPVEHFLRLEDSRWLLPNLWNFTDANGQRNAGNAINTNVAWPREAHGESGLSNGVHGTFTTGWYRARIGNPSGSGTLDVWVPPTGWSEETPIDGFVPRLGMANLNWRRVHRGSGNNVNMLGSDSGGFATPVFQLPTELTTYHHTRCFAGGPDATLQAAGFVPNWGGSGTDVIVESWNMEVSTNDSRGLTNHTTVEMIGNDRSEVRNVLVPNVGNGLCINMGGQGTDFASQTSSSRISVNPGNGLDFTGEITTAFGRRLQIRLRRYAEHQSLPGQGRNTSGLAFDRTRALHVQFTDEWISDGIRLVNRQGNISALAIRLQNNGGIEFVNTPDSTSNPFGPGTAPPEHQRPIRVRTGNGITLSGGSGVNVGRVVAHIGDGLQFFGDDANAQRIRLRIARGLEFSGTSGNNNSVRVVGHNAHGIHVTDTNGVELRLSGNSLEFNSNALRLNRVGNNVAGSSLDVTSDGTSVAISTAAGNRIARNTDGLFVEDPPDPLGYTDYISNTDGNIRILMRVYNNAALRGTRVFMIENSDGWTLLNNRRTLLRIFPGETRSITGGGTTITVTNPDSFIGQLGTMGTLVRRIQGGPSTWSSTNGIWETIITASHRSSSLIEVLVEYRNLSTNTSSITFDYGSLLSCAATEMHTRWNFSDMQIPSPFGEATERN